MPRIISRTYLCTYYLHVVKNGGGGECMLDAGVPFGIAAEVRYSRIKLDR